MSLFDIFNKKNIGETLGSFMGTAKEQASGLTKAAPGGVGGLVGAGALGALLGSFMSKGALQNAALVALTLNAKKSLKMFAIKIILNL